MDAKSGENPPLMGWNIDNAPDLCNLNLCHKSRELTVKHLVHRDAALLSDSVRVTKLAKSLNGGLNEVVRVGRTLRLGKNVGHANSLEDGAHCTATGEASTLGSGLEENLCTAEAEFLLVRESAIDDGNLNKVLLGGLCTLGDGSSDLACLAETHADDTFAITNNNDSSETESAATLGDLGDAVDSYQTILKLKVVGVSDSIVILSHRI